MSGWLQLCCQQPAHDASSPHNSGKLWPSAAHRAQGTDNTRPGQAGTAADQGAAKTTDMGSHQPHTAQYISSTARPHTTTHHHTSNTAQQHTRQQQQHTIQLQQHISQLHQHTSQQHTSQQHKHTSSRQRHTARPPHSKTQTPAKDHTAFHSSSAQTAYRRGANNTPKTKATHPS